MKEENEGRPMGQVIKIDEARIRDHLGEMVRGTVEETLNAMLDAEADELCGAGRYVSHPGRLYGCFLNSSGLILYQSFMACNGDLLPRADCGSCWL